MQQTIEISIEGMDCAECTLHVQEAIEKLPGVADVDVFLASEKAVVRYDPVQVDPRALHRAIEGAGYTPVLEKGGKSAALIQGKSFSRQVLTLFAVIIGGILFLVIAGEWLGLFDAVTSRIPWPVSLGLILAAGYPVFRNVIRAALNRKVIAHTMMTLGVIAAVAVGEWVTAAMVVFLMRAGDFAERFTAERARRAVRDLTALAPDTARVEQAGQEVIVPVREVHPGQIVVVRPGEKIPVDGEIVSGQAAIDQAAITGESMPVDGEPGQKVFAATLVRSGVIRVQTSHAGPDTTFGRVIRLVEAAEGNRASVQRVADRFAGYYLPVVAGIAALTLILRRDPLATAAVLVVACSCSFALATPIAMLASIGAGARRGLLIKGGKYIETLAKATVVLIDKTGTLTLGQPKVTQVISANGQAGNGAASLEAEEVLRLAASAERHSEHPLAGAVLREAHHRGVALIEPSEVTMLAGMGVRARLNGYQVVVGNRRLVEFDSTNSPTLLRKAEELEAQGQTVLFIAKDERLSGLVAVADTLRPEAPASMKALGEFGVKKIELLTGDNERTAAALVQSAIEHEPSLAGQIHYQAGLLPEDKIQVVKEYQAKGEVVVMIGDGVNDAPALAQADIGIAMGAAGSDIAIEAAHIALMREDWSLVPEVFAIARRTMRVVRMNIGFTAVYNLLGLSLAALGFLPPILAAAAQSIPDLGILANSSRLLRQK